MSGFNQNMLKAINAEIEPEKLLQTVGYELKTIQKNGEALKCFCPIHKEKTFRTLMVNIKHKSYRCGVASCPGGRGGNLIDFYAKVKNISNDESAQEIIKMFNIDTNKIKELNLSNGSGNSSSSEQNPAVSSANEPKKKWWQFWK